MFFNRHLVVMLSFMCIASSRESSRKRRYLVYPPNGSKVQFIVGFGLPITVQQQSLTLGTVMKFNYLLPTNATEVLDPYLVYQRQLGPSRWDFYTMLEDAVSRLGKDGRACVLRAICEAADATLKDSGLAGELLHLLFTPSATDEELRSHMDSEYHASERLGLEVPGSCHVLYRECDTSLLDLISKLEIL